MILIAVRHMELRRKCAYVVHSISIQQLKYREGESALPVIRISVN